MAVDVTDDERSTEAHHSFIDKEVHTLRPDWDAIKSSMSRTAAFRRSYMVDASTVDITATYPWLLIPKLVHFCLLYTSPSPRDS